MAAPLLLLALTLASADPDTTLRLPRNGAVEIDTHMRDVTLRIGTTDVVTVRGARAELDGGTLSINDDQRRPPTAGAIDVTVPAWARVDVSTVLGNLTFIGTPERLSAQTVNGFIHMTGGSGTAELETVVGKVVITDFHGSKLSIDATGGPVSVTNATGVISIDNVNGGITLHGIRSMSVEASTINGGIEFEGNFAADGRYDFSSQNDDVTLIVPGDVSARLKISTMNGQLRSPQIPATTNGTQATSGNKGAARNKDKQKDEDGERTFTAVYGSGAARVTIDVFNGDVVVKKKP